MVDTEVINDFLISTLKCDAKISSINGENRTTYMFSSYPVKLIEKMKEDKTICLTLVSFYL